MPDLDYTAVIGVYQGIYNIPNIINQLKAQTIKPKNIVVWINKHTTVHLDVAHIKKTYPDVHVINCTQNYGVFARFSVGMYYFSEYIMVFDDDTIPGIQWAENIAKTKDTTGTAIFGARGISFRNLNGQMVQESFGNEKGTPIITRVDLVGHCWVVPRDLLYLMFEEEPFNPYNAEDIILCAKASIEHGIKTYIPAQPNHIPQVKGSMQHTLGSVPGRLHISNPNHRQERLDCALRFIDKGWDVVYAKEFRK